MSSIESASENEEMFGAPPKDLPRWSDAPSTRRTPDPSFDVRRLDLRQKGDRTRFMEVPSRIYHGDPHYIAPLRLQLAHQLDPHHNPAFDYLDVQALQLFRDGNLVGRLTVQVDHNMETHSGKRAGHFGFFECIDDVSAAHTLLDAGMRWLQEKHCRDVLGPANYTLSHNSGLLVQNFDRPPFVEQLYNPPYYEELLTSYGFAKAKDFWVWWIDLEAEMDTPNRKRVDRIAERIREREGVTFRHVDFRRVKEEIGSVHRIFTEAWRKNWGFAPLPAREFEAISTDIKQIALPELLLFVQVGGKDVGFSLTVPNVNEKLPRNGRLFPFGWTGLLRIKKTRHARLYLLGTLPQYRKRGLESIMMAETVRRCLAAGITGGEIGWTLEDNHLINRSIEGMDARLDRVYRIFGMTF